MAKRDFEPSDTVLVVASVLGDLEAFDHLVWRYRAAVVQTARAIVGPDHAEDVAQESLLLAFKALPSIEDPSKFAAWLSAITRHRASRYGKQERARTHGRVVMDDLLLERLPSLSRQPERDDRSGELYRALGSIDVDYALPLRLHFFDGMPLKRIAAYLGLPVSTVKWRIYRGKKLLREHLQQNDLEVKNGKTNGNSQTR